MRAPNILYLHSHDTGVDIAPYGYEVHTPVLQAFAERGARFTRAFSVAPTCSPSRAGLLTGRYPHEVGMTGLAHRGFVWDDYRRHLVKWLSSFGYTTALCGVQHVAPRRTMLGYDEYLDGSDGRDYFGVPGLDPVSYDRANAQRAAEWISKRADGSAQDRPARFAAPQADPAGSSHVGRPHAEPWFLSVGLLATHRPFPGADEVTTAEADRTAYRRSAEEMDRAVGTVLDAVERSGLWESTVVLYTTDHGTPFPGYKGELRDAGTRVALVLWVPPGVPGAESAGKTYDQLVSQIDLFPTILELAGEGERRGDAEGAARDGSAQHAVGVSGPATAAAEPRDAAAPWAARSIVPLLSGRSPAVRDTVYAESNYHAAYEPARTVRTDLYRLIIRPPAGLSRAPANVDDCPEKEQLRSTGRLTEDHPLVELYDLTVDPGETINRAEDARYAAVREELERRIADWMHGTCDPLLSGVVEAPPGATVDPVSRWSPS